MLGLQLWERQVEMLRAIATHLSVAVKSGQKSGKSTAAVAGALWFVCTRPRARVFMTASSDQQVRDVLWKELARVYDPVRRVVGGERMLDPSTGLRFPDGREVVGFATKKPENMAGRSGPEMLMLADEASGIDEPIFEAIEGNRAAGARFAMFSNPTRTSGKFFRAFHEEREFWHLISISSEEAAQTGIPGLAVPAYIEQRKAEWGVESALYQVRVAGNFPSEAENAVIGLRLLEDAQARWETTPAEGPLEAGLDPARFGDDEAVLVVRRGKKVLGIHATRHQDGPGLAAWTLGVLKNHRDGDEKPRVKVDVIGVGASVYDALRQSKDIEAVAVNVSNSATSDKFPRLRDQLWFATRDWLKEGGALPGDAKLESELLAPTFGFDAQGRQKVESKDDIKKRLGRSPDRADALALAVYKAPARRVVRSTSVRGASFDDLGYE